MRPLLLHILVLVLLTASTQAHGGASPDGGVQQVNVQRDGRSPAIAADLATGQQVVVWETTDASVDGVAARLLGAPDDIPVNTNTQGDQDYPDVSYDADGNFVVVWRDHQTDSIRMRAFRPDGTPRSGEVIVRMTPLDFLGEPAIAHNGPQGGFVVAWSENEGAGYDVWARPYTINGVPLAAPFRVNTTTTNHQNLPDVARAPDGTTLITWSSNQAGVLESDVYATLYNGDGTVLQPEFQVNVGTAEDASSPEVSRNPADGTFIISWRSSDGGTANIVMRRYDASGVPISGDLPVHPHADGSRIHNNLAHAPDGDFILTWRNALPSGQIWIEARCFDSTGSPLGEVWTVRDGNNQKSFPRVAWSETDRFDIVWEEETDTDTFDVLRQSYVVTTTGIQAAEPVSTLSMASSARPSVFRSETRITYALPGDGPVTLRIYDVHGRIVRTLLENTLAPTRHGEIAWDGRDSDRRAVADGMYFYRLEQGNAKVTGKLTRVR